MSDDILSQTTTTESFTTQDDDSLLQQIVLHDLTSQGVVGPAGPAGAPGTPGAPGQDGSDAMLPWHVYETLLSGPQSTFAVSPIADLNSVSVFIRGLRQASASYLVDYEMITFLGVDIPTTGDTVAIIYQ